MNKLIKSSICLRLTRPFLQCRKLCDAIIITKGDRDIRVAEREIRLNISNAFSKEIIQPHIIANILKVIRYDIGRFSNSLTKDLFDKVWIEVKKKNVPVDISHVNMTMYGLLGNKIEFDPTKILKDIKEHNLSMNNETFDLLLKSYCLIGDMESSLKLVSKMYTLNIYFNATKYAWLIGCAIRSDDTERVEEYFAKVEGCKSKISHPAYGFIGSAYASKLDIENCIRMLDMVKSSKDNYRIKSINRYDSYIELVNSGASEDILLRFIDYMNQEETFTELLDGITKLNKKYMFEASLLLIKHTSVDLSVVQWKLLLLRFLSINPPNEHLQFLISKVEKNPQIMIYVLQFYRPFDEALKLAAKYLSYNNIVVNERVTERLINNALNEIDPVKACKKVLLLLRSLVVFDHYYTIIITRVLSKLLTLDHYESYKQIIDTFVDLTDDSDKNNFIFCCVLHATILKNKTEAKQLIETCFGQHKYNFNIRIRNIAYFLFANKSVEEVCEVIAATASFMTPMRHLCFIEDILEETLRFQTVDVFEKLFKFAYANTVFKDNLKSIAYLKKNKSCTAEIAGIMDKLSSAVES